MGSCVGRQLTVQQHHVPSTGEESWKAIKIITSNWKASSKNQQHNLRETVRKEQTRVQADGAAGLRVLKAYPVLAYTTAGSSFIWVTR